MNLMADSRHLTLKQQALAPTQDHQEGSAGLSPQRLQAIVDFESQVYVAQAVNRLGRSLVEPDGPPGLGPRAMAEGRMHVLANNNRDPVFRVVRRVEEARDASPRRACPAASASLRASVARGNDIFMFRQFWIRDVAHINSIGLGNPIKRTLHDVPQRADDGDGSGARLGGCRHGELPDLDRAAGVQRQGRAAGLQGHLRHASAPPHPYLGRTIYTTDPGRALITGRCNDVGSHRHAAVPRPGRAGAVLLERLGRRRCASSWTSTTGAST